MQNRLCCFAMYHSYNCTSNFYTKFMNYCVFFYNDFKKICSIQYITAYFLFSHYFTDF